MKKTFVLPLGALCAALTLPGCISHEETTYSDVERVRVSFENDSAARIFYEALAAAPHGRSTDSTTEVEIPLVFKVKSHVIPGQNAAFNQGVAKCDTNKDGIITETEARIFAENKSKL